MGSASRGRTRPLAISSRTNLFGQSLQLPLGVENWIRRHKRFPNVIPNSMSANTDQLEGAPNAEAMVRLAKLWSAASPSLEAFVRSLVRDPHDVDDVIQETGAYVAREFHTFEEGTSFTGWVITVARIRVQRLWQGQKRDRLILNSEAIDALAQTAEAIGPQLPARQTAMQDCVEKLQPRHQQLLEMCYLNGKKPAQIADQLGRTPNAVSASLMRIRHALKRCIEDRLSLCERGGL